MVESSLNVANCMDSSRFPQDVSYLSAERNLSELAWVIAYGYRPKAVHISCDSLEACQYGNTLEFMRMVIEHQRRQGFLFSLSLKFENTQPVLQWLQDREVVFPRECAQENVSCKECRKLVRLGR